MATPLAIEYLLSKTGRITPATRSKAIEIIKVAQANGHRLAHFLQGFRPDGLGRVGRHDERARLLLGFNGIAGPGAWAKDPAALFEAARLDILAISELWHGLAPC